MRKVNIVEATKKALEQGTGIINEKLEAANYYILPTNTAECFLLIPIGLTHASQEKVCPRWNPKATDILSDDWQVYHL